MATFWKLCIYSTITPRYLLDVEHDAINISEVGPNWTSPSFKPLYTWSFDVKVKSSKPITFYNSPSHELEHISMAIDKREAVFALSKHSKPNKDFTFVYTTEGYGEPGYVLGRTDTSLTAMISFIPKFADLKINDAYEMQVKNKSIEYDMEVAKG